MWSDDKTDAVNHRTMIYDNDTNLCVLMTKQMQSTTEARLIIMILTVVFWQQQNEFSKLTKHD
jgi:hypothetical protein